MQRVLKMLGIWPEMWSRGWCESVKWCVCHPKMFPFHGSSGKLVVSLWVFLNSWVLPTPPLHHFLHWVHHSLYQNPPTPTPKPPPLPSLHSLHQLCSLYEVPKACMVVCMDLDPSLLVHTGIDVYNYVCPFRFTWCGKAIGLRISKRRAYWTSVYRTEAGFSRSVLSLAAVCSPSLRIHVCMCCGWVGGRGASQVLASIILQFDTSASGSHWHESPECWTSNHRAARETGPQLQCCHPPFALQSDLFTSLRHYCLD